MTVEDRIARNATRCGPNLYLEFRGAVAVPAQDRYGNDYTRLDIVLSDGFSIKFFDPKKSQRERSKQAVKLASLCDALMLDFDDIPPCKGGWEEFVQEVCSLVNTRKYTMLYAKITLTEAGWLDLGEGKCFSLRADMEYTDADLHFLPNGQALGGNHPIIETPEVPGKAPQEEKPKPVERPKKDDDKVDAPEPGEDFLTEFERTGKVTEPAWVEEVRQENAKKPPVDRKKRTSKKDIKTPPMVPIMPRPNPEDVVFPEYDDLPF